MQERSLDRAQAHKPIVIEVAGEPLGVVVPHADGYRFLAVKLPVEKAHFAVSQAVRKGGADAA